jgi:hypothetical protein
MNEYRVDDALRIIKKRWIIYKESWNKGRKASSKITNMSQVNNKYASLKITKV